MDWASRNKMKFHPDKCKALMVYNLKLPLLGVLPGIQYFYSLGNEIIDYCESEKDLGIYINGTLNFSYHSDILYAKANQRFGLLKRTCHFVRNISAKRALYLTMVRSIFEHCPVVWKPASQTSIAKLESLQKRAIKWIRADSNESSIDTSYSEDSHLYYVHCSQLNILPIEFRFNFHDLKIFHSIVNGFSCVKLPDYINPFEGTRLRNSHLDQKCFTSTVIPQGLMSNRNFENVTNHGFRNSFYYRVHLMWNKLPLNLREIVCPGTFKIALLRHIWHVDVVNKYEQCLDDNGIESVVMS